jgi:4-azaleucine resistance transporter AzlC
MKLADGWIGLKAAAPIMLGYIPVAVAFGVAGVAAGFQPWQVMMMSAIIYAGASQFVLLASFASGMSWLWVVGLCALMNARHLLYGPLLAAWLPAGRRFRISFAAGLTDEVFATALARLASVVPKQRGPWLSGVALGAYLAWVGGTALGAYSGGQLEQASPMLAQAMQFSLPALFLALAWQCFSRQLLWPLLIAALLAGALALSGHGSVAILGGAAAGTLCFWLMPGQAASAQEDVCN